MRLRILTNLFRQKFVRKTLKYTKYSCGFPPFSDEKSLARLSCRFVRYCHRKSGRPEKSDLPDFCLHFYSIARIFALGTTPTEVFTAFPFLNTISVGMLMTPN